MIVRVRMQIENRLKRIIKRKEETTKEKVVKVEINANDRRDEEANLEYHC